MNGKQKNSVIILVQELGCNITRPENRNYFQVYQHSWGTKYRSSPTAIASTSGHAHILICLEQNVKRSTCTHLNMIFRTEGIHARMLSKNLVDKRYEKRSILFIRLYTGLGVEAWGDGPTYHRTETFHWATLTTIISLLYTLNINVDRLSFASCWILIIA
jgi:hypothetical protein